MTVDDPDSPSDRACTGHAVWTHRSCCPAAVEGQPDKDNWLADRRIKVGNAHGKGGTGAESGCRRHFPDRADGHGSQARSEGEGLLSRVHGKPDDEVIAESLS